MDQRETPRLTLGQVFACKQQLKGAPLPEYLENTDVVLISTSTSFRGASVIVSLQATLVLEFGHSKLSF